jgi:hypothetical protein
VTGYLVTAPVEGDVEPEGGLLDQPFDLGGGASLSVKPAWLTAKAIPAEALGSSDHYRALKAPYIFLLERPNEILQMGDWEADQETLRAMQQCIWIASGIRLEWDLMFLMKPDDSGETCRRWDRMSRQVKPLKAPDPKLRRVQMEEARQILAVIRTLPRKGALWTAIRIAAFALDEPQGDIALVLAWAGLEALFGPDSPGETVHRTSMNLALFLAPNGKEAQELSHRVRQSYTLRSKVVHGRQSGLAPGSEAAKAVALLNDTVAWLREGTRRIALDGGLRETFQSPEERSAFLEALPFRIGQSMV